MLALYGVDDWRQGGEAIGVRVDGIVVAATKLELHCQQGLSRDYHAGLLGIAE